jgi:hypothetical protein
MQGAMKALTTALATRSTSKLWSAGAAFFALFFLVLQPVCAAFEGHIGAPNVASAATAHDAGHADDASRGSHDCTALCSEMRAEATALASPVAADKNFPAAGLIVALPLAFLARPELTLRSRTARAIPPVHPLSYHARSARILR